MMKFQIILLLLVCISCSRNSERYKITNNLLRQKNIKLLNLSEKPFYINEALLYFEKKEFTNLNFDIEKEKIYKLDTFQIKNKVYDIKSNCKSRISLPLFSKNSKRALIGIEEKCGTSEKNIIIYLLKIEKNEWKVEANIESSTKAFN